MLNDIVNPGFGHLEFNSPWTSSVILLAAASSVLLILSTFYAYLFSDSKANKIHELRGFSILNAWAFFNKRYDFLRSNFDKTGHDLFSFKVLQVSLCLCSYVFCNDYVVI
jgi:hypothetical protein